MSYGWGVIPQNSSRNENVVQNPLSVVLSGMFNIGF